MKYLYRYAAMFGPQIYIHADDVAAVAKNAFCKPETAYESFLLGFVAANYDNCIARYVSLQTIHHLQQFHALFSGQFRYYYRDHGALTAVLLNSRIFVKQTRFVQICGREPYYALTENAALYSRISVQRMIDVYGNFKNEARALISVIPRIRAALTALPPVLSAEDSLNFLHKTLCRPLRRVLNSRELRGFILQLRQSLNDFMASPHARYEGLALNVVLPFLSRFFVYSEGALIYRAKITHERLRIVSAEFDSGNEPDNRCPNALHVIPKKDGDMRPVFRSSQNAEMLPALQLLFRRAPTLRECVRAIGPDSKFYDMDNAFGEVDQRLLMNLLESRIQARNSQNLLIYYQGEAFKQPTHTLTISAYETVERLRAHVLGFRFYDPFCKRVFELKKGLPQGNPLSSLLFKVYADYWLAKAVSERFLVLGRSFTVTKYVDNIALTGNGVFTTNLLPGTRQMQEFCSYRADHSQVPGKARSAYQIIKCRPEEAEQAIKTAKCAVSPESVHKLVLRRLTLLKTLAIPNAYKYKLACEICAACKRTGIMARKVTGRHVKLLRIKYRQARRLLHGAYH